MKKRLKMNVEKTKPGRIEIWKASQFTGGLSGGDGYFQGGSADKAKALPLTS